MGWQHRRRAVKIIPGLCHSHSELLVPEMLPLTSSQGSNTDPDSSICVRGQEESLPIGFAPAQSSSCNLFLFPELPCTSLVLSLPARLSVQLQSCGSRHCWDSDHAPRGLRKGSDEPGCPVVISALSVASMCIPL